MLRVVVTAVAQLSLHFLQSRSPALSYQLSARAMRFCTPAFPLRHSCIPAFPPGLSPCNRPDIDRPASHVERLLGHPVADVERVRHDARPWLQLGQQLRTKPEVET